MPFNHPGAEVAVVSTSAILTVGPTLFCLPQFIKRLRATGKRSADALYEDEDGVATPESMARYVVRPQKIVLLLAACCGLGFSVASGINATVNAESNFSGTASGGLLTAWLFTANWVCFETIFSGKYHADHG
jgi:hypothetical protein